MHVWCFLDRFWFNRQHQLGMWPFTSSYPERAASEVHGKTFDYIVVGGTYAVFPTTSHPLFMLYQL